MGVSLNGTIVSADGTVAGFSLKILEKRRRKKYDGLHARP